VWTTANLLTSARIVLIVPFLYSIHEGRLGLALIIFFVAGITDFFDGYVARRFNQQSALGRFLDPMADHLNVHGLGSISEIFDGDAPFHGAIDETRVYAQPLGAAWIATEYANLTSNGFTKIGSEQSRP